MTVLEVGVTALMAAATFVLSRRHPSAAFALVVGGLLLASSSIGDLKEVFLTARWGGLVALPLALLWPLPRRLQDLSLELAVVGITAILALSAAWSIDPQLTLMRAASFGLMLFGVVRLVNRVASSSGALVDSIAALAGVVAAASVLLWLLRPDIAVYVGELRGMLENQNGLGLFLGLTYPFVLAVVDRRVGRRIWLVAMAVPVALMIGLTESRSGALALVVGLTAYELASRFPRRLLLHLLVAISGFMAMSLSVTSLGAGTPAASTPSSPAPGGTPPPTTAPPPQRPDVLGGGGAAGQGRLTTLLGARDEAWSATAHLIGDRPLLGYGFGSGDRVFARYPERAKFRFFQGANPNNGYLQALLELGLVLSLAILLPLLFALATGIGTAFRRAFSPDRAAFLACLAAGLAAGVFESLFTAAGAPWAMLIWLSAAALLYEWATRRAEVGGRAQYHRLS